jgi:hypothetical protein
VSDSNANAPDEELLEFFKVFSDVDRLKVAGLLAAGPRTVDEMAAALDMPGRSVIRHLQMLAHAGFVAENAAGVYEFRPKAMEGMAHRLLAGRRPAHKVDDESMAGDEHKVLADFMTPDGRLKHLPAQQKKCEIVLRHISHIFAPGERYSEKQVNQMLLRFNEDTAALRRGLVDYHFMARQAGVYWRSDEVAG